MTNLKARVSYLQGLYAGMELDSNAKEGKLLNGIIGVLEEFANSFKELTDVQDGLEDYIETIDEDLYQLEDVIYKDNGIDREDDLIEVDCPRCGEVVCFDSKILEEDDLIEVTCPNCNEVVYTNDDTLKVTDEPELLGGQGEKVRTVVGRSNRIEDKARRIGELKKGDVDTETKVRATVENEDI